ncbi:hypothetical protein EG240_11400 [Paenimyroides tangerinum]|uniref:Uncharacterized protein n=1 Tax=Paenimyroides tangerinum TaxID=2488728 RepID=A0A3P3W514_9FLAO|nr:hypothetical protein [Paenimyroides tangerinum]RRJ89528.1 hypothetical protein EG240_11400 [Paenimyroides tangerinum]
MGYPQKFDIKENDFSKINIKLPINKTDGKNITTDNYFDEIISELSPFGKKKNVSQIFQIVEFYLSFPANRDATIDFNGKSTNYENLFKEILVNRKHLNQHEQMFYTRLLISKDRNPNKTFKDIYSKVYIKLFPGDQPEQYGQIDRYELIIEKKDITPTKLNLIEKNFLEEYEKSKLKKENYSLYVFFVGNAPKSSKDRKFDLINNYIYFEYTEVRETNYDSF